VLNSGAGWAGATVLALASLIEGWNRIFHCGMRSW